MTYFWKRHSFRVLRGIFLPVLLFSGMACVKKQTEPSMPRDKMVKLLVDVHLAEAALQNVFGAAKDSLAEVYYKDICAIHRLNRQQLDKVLAELRQNPLVMSETYREVIQRIERRNEPEGKD
ncbi:MAG: DUF4296 domain-containing protein [Haliscomenobacter sp.]|nr:DUF4296 domain-containing protein [Haliscomenobacter sp.]